MSDNTCQQILIVDDELGIRVLMSEILNSKRRKVISFEDPVEALAYAGEHPFHVAILDFVMPGMTGIELASRLKAIQPECFVALCTGHLAEHCAGLREAEEVDHLIRKPFDVAELIDLCDRAGKN